MKRFTMAGFCPVILASWFCVILYFLKTPRRDLRHSAGVNHVLPSVVAPDRSGSALFVLAFVFGRAAEGITYEADPRHAETLIEAMGLQEAKALSTPGSKVVGKEEAE